MSRRMLGIMVFVFVAFAAASCANGESPGTSSTSDLQTTSTAAATTTGGAPTSSVSATTEPATTSTTLSASVEGAWIGRTVELRFPPGGEGIDYGFDPHNMQTTVWIDGEFSGLWAWEYIGYFGAGGRSIHGVAVIGEGPDPHRAQWEEEANRQFPLPVVVPVEPGMINDLMLWALTEDDQLPDGTGAVYTIIDSQPFRLVESDSWGATSHCYYSDWDWNADIAAPFLFGWVDTDDYGPTPESSEPDPVTPRIAFEVVQTPDGHRIAAVDPKTMTCG